MDHLGSLKKHVNPFPPLETRNNADHRIISAPLTFV
jgi:hypothetical protein